MLPTAPEIASPAIANDARAVLDFWFGTPADPGYGQPRKTWFGKDPAFDAAIRQQFGGLYDRAVAGECDPWADHAADCLALILVFDQFPRNMFRESPKAFATDKRAVDLARRAVAESYDRTVPAAHRTFYYLPFEHSENLADQNRAVSLYSAMEPHPGRELGIDYAVRHRDIVARFGRFPHRNAVLGRASTTAELAFLKESGSSF